VGRHGGSVNRTRDRASDDGLVSLAHSNLPALRTLIGRRMFDGKGERVNDPVRNILQLPPEDRSVDFVRTTGQIAISSNASTLDT
jgi:hypothetical protein